MPALLVTCLISYHFHQSVFLATSLTGVFPSDVCSRIVEDPSSIVNFECPINCDNVLEYVNADCDASNGCGGLGFGLGIVVITMDGLILMD